MEGDWTGQSLEGTEVLEMDWKKAAETKRSESSGTRGESTGREGVKGRSSGKCQGWEGTEPSQTGTQGAGSEGRITGKSRRTEQHSVKTDF